MYLKKLFRLRKTLVFRLTLWYSVIFAISSFLAFFVSYLLINSVIQERTNQDLLEDVQEFSALLALKGMEEVKAEMILESESDGADKVFYRILTPNGEEIASSDMSSWENAGPDTTILKRLTADDDHRLETLSIPGHPYKVRTIHGIIGPGKILQIGLSLEEDAEFIEAFRKIFSTTIVILMVFAALVGWFMAKRALLGVEEVTRTAQEITERTLEKRVPIKARGDEIERLATTFNNMLERIHSLVIGVREMSDNIAHDLRNPISRIRGIAETTLTSGKSVDEYEAMAASTIEECDKLLEMINTMLDISEADVEANNLAMEEIDIVNIIRNACELFQPIAEDKGIHVISEVPTNCFLYGDIQKLQRMVANLLDNALKYTPTGGTITLSVNGDEKNVVLSVHDTGLGISEDDLPHIFRRFYRCDQSRSQAGIGLGLSLAMAIARSHNGNIIAASHLGKGSTFTVTLSRAPLS